MIYLQKEISLPAYPRGFHLITREIIQALTDISKIGIGHLQVFIKHTSASLTINENADPMDIPEYTDPCTGDGDPP